MAQPGHPVSCGAMSTPSPDDAAGGQISKLRTARRPKSMPARRYAAALPWCRRRWSRPALHCARPVIRAAALSSRAAPTSDARGRVTGEPEQTLDAIRAPNAAKADGLADAYTRQVCDNFVAFLKANDLGDISVAFTPSRLPDCCATD